MKIGILKKNDKKIDDFLLLKKAGQRRGHIVELISLENIKKDIENGKIIWQDDQGPISRFDAILVRGGKGFVQERYELLSWFNNLGKIVVDKTYAQKVRHSDKINDLKRLRQQKIKVPEFYILKKSLLKQVEKIKFPIMLKHKKLHRGEGVILIKNFHQLKRELKKIGKNDNWYLQEFINWDKDIRVFVIGDKVLGAIKRIPSKNEYRANISLGGRAKPYDLAKNLGQIAKKANEALNLEIAGVDFLLQGNNYFIIEVNAYPQFYGFAKTTGINIALELIKYLEKRFKG